MKNKTFQILAPILALMATGCTVVSHKTKDVWDFYASIGSKKHVQSVKYGDFELKGVKVDEASGLKSAAEGAVKGFNPSWLNVPHQPWQGWENWHATNGLFFR